MSLEPSRPPEDCSRRSDDRWRATLDVAFAKTPFASTRVSHRHFGPLRVQRPFFPEGARCPHVYVLHPPGGVVSGDDLAIDVAVGPGAAGLVTTPAAGKFYRSGGDEATQRHTLRIALGGALEWLPQENIFFDGCRAIVDTRVEIEAGAHFVGWEVSCLGRPASRELFRAGECRTSFDLHVDGAPVFIERAVYEGGSALLEAPWGLGGMTTVGLLAVYPASAGMLASARAIAAPSEGDLASASLLEAGGGLLCCRYLGASALSARAHFVRVWEAIRPPLLGRVAVPPRIWST